MAFNQLLNREHELITVQVTFYLDVIGKYDKKVMFTVEVNPIYTSYRVIHSQVEAKQAFIDLLVRARKREIFYTLKIYGEFPWIAEKIQKISNLIWEQDPLQEVIYGI